MIGYDVIVVGGGHAGCEAALAAARSGARTLLITLRRDLIACMPCNPSIGGIAKSHLVYELDALGGEMGVNADYTGIQFKMLNTRRGPAVQSTRAQCDKTKYSERMQAVIAATLGLDVCEAPVTGILVSEVGATGVRLRGGAEITSKSVVLTPGTALNGVIHIGDRHFPGGGNGGETVDELSVQLSEFGFAMARLKTGTPPRLHRHSIDYSQMAEQPGDDPAPLFSWLGRRDARLFHVEQKAPEKSIGDLFHVEQVTPSIRPWPPGSGQMPCFLTHTNAATHSIIRDNLDRSAMYGGQITGTGVRYCPSVEDKIVKFPDKDSHHVFIEPEGRDSDLVYPNGISNSLPEDTQAELVRSIEGLNRAVIVRPAFAIEYDFCDPTQLRHTLETKPVENLFMAGQINGTTGYEEAAAQGFVAGVNAARKARGLDQVVFSRQEAYIGVLIDDLVTKGTSEPYRMFTSRAERRLILRQDNARYRLIRHAVDIGIVTAVYVEETRRFSGIVETELGRLSHEVIDGVSAIQVLRRPETSYSMLPCRDTGLDNEVVRQVEILAKYEGYIRQEEVRAEKAIRLDAVTIPPDIDYWRIKSLRRETQEKLSRLRPVSIGQAARIPGVGPADILIIGMAVEKYMYK